MKIQLRPKRQFLNRTMLTLSVLITLITLIFLVWILASTIRHGIGALAWNVFSKNTPAPGSNGGLANAIAGSVLMVAIGIIIGGPVGILAGTFLAEFGSTKKITEIIRFLNDVLLSAPSIITGLFVYGLIVVTMKQFSGIAGAAALAVIALPIVVRTTDEMLRLVPSSLREAAFALGAPKWKVVTAISYRAAAPGLLTGLLLAVARISGETAPLLFTALNNQFGNFNIFKPMASLPVVIFQFAMSPYEGWKNLAWAGAFIAVAAVLGFNLLSRWILARNRH